MLKTVKAKYKNGIFEPLEKVDIEDGTEAQIIFNDNFDLTNEEKLKLFISSAGSWKNFVDENFLSEIYEQRKLKTRKEIEL